MQAPAFRLRRYFSLASGAAVVAVSLLISWAYYQEELSTQVEAAETRNVMLAQTFANSIWPLYSEFLARPVTDSGALQPDARTESLDRLVKSMSRGVPVVKIKIYNRDGLAVYSSVRSEIGEDKSANPGFRQARSGKASSDLTHRGSMSATEGRIENVEVVSTYIPIGENGRVEAVFELYSDVTEAVASVQRDLVRLAVVLVVLFGALYGALLLIVMRADRIIQQQYRALESERLSRLKRFFSPQVAELISAGGMDDPLKTHRREITAVSIDLRGFTAFTESAEPEEVIGLLREYHEQAGRVILKHEGTIEYFAGDGVMVIFNDPVPVTDAAERAVRMSVEMQDAFEAIAARWRARGFDLGLGVGIAQGYATIGAIGFEGRRDYAAIGSVTNLAARLCGEARPGQILVCRKVKASAGEHIRVESTGELKLKGFAQPVTAFWVRRPAPIIDLPRAGVAAL